MMSINFLIYYLAFISHSDSLNIKSNLSKVIIKQKPFRKTLTVNGCGLSHVSNKNKIVGGIEAQIGQFPWQVWLKIIGVRPYPLLCSGSIINENWVLTAAHCVSEVDEGKSLLQSIEVGAGSHNIIANSEKVQHRFADCVIIHDNWSGILGNFGHDIALLRIPANNPFNITHKTGGFVNGVCLPPKTYPPFAYTGKARISGWGLTSETGNNSVVLKYTNVTVINDNECRKYEMPVPIIDSMICQGIDRTSPCFGDSGGPLIADIESSDKKMTQIGIVSLGAECASQRLPNGIYTEVSHFLGWIEQNIRRYDGNVRCGDARALRVPTPTPMPRPRPRPRLTPTTTPTTTVVPIVQLPTD